MSRIMKKILLFLIIGGALVTASCTKRYDVVEPNQSLFHTVATTDWAVTADGKSDSVSIPAKQIGNYFNDSGAVLVYFSFFQGSYEQIPEVYNNVSYSYYNDAGNLVLYSQNAAGTAPYLPTQDINVKLVLVAAN
jgi:hypothetical protein